MRAPPDRAGARPAAAAVVPQADAAAGGQAAAAQRDAPAGGRVGRVAAAADPAGLPRANAPRRRHTASASVTTPISLHEGSGGMTPLTAYAPVAAALAAAAPLPAAAPRAPGLPARLQQAWRGLVGAPEPVIWLQQRMRVLRAEAIDQHAPDPADAPVSAEIPLGRGAENPVARFWRQPVVAGNADAALGPAHDALVAALDRIARRDGAFVGLGLSLALRSATRPGAAAEPGALQAFAGDAPLGRILAADAGQGGEPAAIALRMLRKAAKTPQFAALARGLAPGLREDQLAPLRRMLEAHEARDTATLAGRVHRAAREALRQGRPLADRADIVDAFLWDNHFREEGPGTPLEQARAHFAKVVTALAGEQRLGGLMSAACEFGLSGADRHLLVDEAARLTRLRDSAGLDATVATLRRALSEQLQEALRDCPAPGGVDRVVRTLARLMALEDWSPPQRQGLGLAEMVEGRPHRSGTDATRDRVARFCDGHGLTGDPEAAIPPMPAALRASVIDRVDRRLGSLRLGIEDLVGWARELDRGHGAEEPPWAQEMRALVHGHTRKPSARTPAAVGEMLGAFLGQVQFGNHVRLSQVTAGALSSRGAGVNITAFAEGGQLAAVGPREAGLATVPAANFLVGAGSEQVLRVGAATHGVEIFLGQQHESFAGAGIGWGIGYPQDRALHVRGGAGADALHQGHRSTRLEGLMLRIDRQVIVDHDDGNGQRQFRQNDDAVRRAAADLARQLMHGAPLARTDAERAALLDDLIVRFQACGLSMTLVGQTTSTRRVELGLSAGASYAVGPREAGVRFGASVSLGGQYARSTDLTQRDTTGRFRATIERRGWYARAAVSGGISANVYIGPAGLPPVPLLRGSQVRDEAGGAVRVRVPTRDGRIVAEKTFSDTDTASPDLLREIVNAKRQAWVDLFAHPHAGDSEPGRERGERALDAFFQTIEGVRAGNQRYYARERLHADAAQRLDELASLAMLVPAGLPAVRDEIAVQRRMLIADDASWMPASLIAYERHAVERGAAGSHGVQARHTMAAEGEREFVFHTPGWAALRERELRGPPASVVALDRRRMSP